MKSLYKKNEIIHDGYNTSPGGKKKLKNFFQEISKDVKLYEVDANSSATLKRESMESNITDGISAKPSVLNSAAINIVKPKEQKLEDFQALV